MVSELSQRPTGLLADLLRVATLVSIVAAVLWYPLEAVIRFALLLLILLAPRVLNVPRPFDAAFCATLLLAAWAAVGQWYVTVPWMDELVHFAATGATAAMLYLVLARLGLLSDPQDAPIRQHRSSAVILTLSLGLAAASLWELYEWIANQFLPNTIHVGYDDTILDLTMGGIGSLLAGLVLSHWAASGHGSRRLSKVRARDGEAD